MTVVDPALATALPNGLYVDGGWMPGRGETFTVLNPATERPLLELQTADLDQVDMAVAAARTARVPMRGAGGAARAGWLESLASALERDAPRFSALEALNTGKPLHEASGDVAGAVRCLRYYASLATGLDDRQGELVGEPRPDFEVRLRYEPVGVAVGIVPWNFPLLMAVWKLAPAFAAGCPLILKPSEYTPLTALALAQLVAVLPIPRGAFAVLPGTGAVVGEALVSHRDVAKVAFTGSPEAGARVAALAAGAFKRVTVEAGGKSALLAFADTPVEVVVEWIMQGIWYNQGQVCNATSRVLIERPMYDAVVDRLCAESVRIVVGPPTDASATMGPLQNARQRSRFLQHVAAVRAAGGRIRLGGGVPFGRPNGYFVEPTVVTDLPRDCITWREEVFGPLVVLQPFADEAEAIALADDSDYGLAASVLTEDAARAARIAAALEVGCVWIRCNNYAFPQGPWGGPRRSGLGRELGRWGLEAYLEVKQVTSYAGGRPPFQYVRDPAL